MKKESASGSIKLDVSPGRRHFHRKSIGDARLELSQIDSREKIIEACLLTAIGTLGITCGFSGITFPGNPMVKLVSRGLDARATDFVEKKFEALIPEYFPSLQSTQDPFYAGIHNLQGDNKRWAPLDDAGIRILIGWRMGKETFGVIGLGTKIISDTYVDDEINFLLSLTDTMVYALESLEIRRRIQGLKKDLDREKERSADLLSGIKSAKRELDHTRFRLSGFNDIFNELSGIKESTGVIDSFLLELLGIFSAAAGYICHLDQTRETAHMTVRGPGMMEGTVLPSTQVQKGIYKAFASIRSLQLSQMQVSILSPQQMDCFKPFLPDTAIGLIYKVDDTAMGVMGLGDRFTQTSYGEAERELLYAFAKNFLVFLKSSKSFETIQRLNAEQAKQNMELEKTINALSDSRHTITRLEKTSERIKTAITKTMAQSKKVSLLDTSLILIAGIVLGLVYNFASPGGINVLPKAWFRPAMAHVGMDQARQLFETQNALFVDARPAEFFNQAHISGALNLPSSLFDFIYMMQFGQIDVNRPIVVYGRNISRRYDEETAFLLSERGHEMVMVFVGRLEEWEKRGGGVTP